MEKIIHVLRIFDHFYFESRNQCEIPHEIDFGLAGLQKESLLGVNDRGDIPRMEYRNERGELVNARNFEFQYRTLEDGSTELTVLETPIWVDVMDQEHPGPVKRQTYSGIRYNAWRDSARQRIFEALKTWIPAALLAIGQVRTIPEGEAMSGAWLTAHAGVWDFYVKTGRKEPFELSLSKDSTPWLETEIPDGAIKGLNKGSSVRQLITQAMR